MNAANIALASSLLRTINIFKYSTHSEYCVEDHPNTRAILKLNSMWKMNQQL